MHVRSIQCQFVLNYAKWSLWINMILFVSFLTKSLFFQVVDFIFQDPHCPRLLVVSHNLNPGINVHLELIGSNNNLRIADIISKYFMLNYRMVKHVSGFSYTASLNVYLPRSCIKRCNCMMTACFRMNLKGLSYLYIFQFRPGLFIFLTTSQ